MADRIYDAADLYDLAFSWNLDSEVDWLLTRLGPSCRSVLEPGCGPGRHLRAFADWGVAAVGIDHSPAMLELARQRLADAPLTVELIEADLCTFDLAHTVDAAVCPINTLAHLPDDAAMSAHLHRVAAHLPAGGSYLVQLDLRDPDDPGASHGSGSWEAERDGVRVRATWTVADVDLDAGVERQHAQLAVQTGPRAGEIVAERFTMGAWTPSRWAAVVADSPFTQVAAFDGNADARPPVDPAEPGDLVWHELVVGSPAAPAALS